MILMEGGGMADWIRPMSETKARKEEREPKRACYGKEAWLLNYNLIHSIKTTLKPAERKDPLPDRIGLRQEY